MLPKPVSRMPTGWKVGDPIPDEHPWKNHAGIFHGHRDKTGQVTQSFRYRAKPLERDRLDMRLRPETRDAINDFIRDLGWTATEVLEYAITDAHRRIYGGVLSAPDDLPLLDAGDMPDREAWAWNDKSEVA